MFVFRRTNAVLIAVAICMFPPAHACGPFLPNRFLRSGGKSILDAPEFYFELEMKRLAKAYPCPFRTIAPAPPAEQDPAAGEGDNSEARLFVRQTAQADQRDFAAAMAEGELQPPDKAQADAQHAAARKFLNETNPDDLQAPPEEFPSEFADYHRGAIAFRRQRYEEARTIWTRLLERPAAERRYRSTWAAYMIGKIDLLQVHPEAREHFALVRKLATDGFTDSLGLAAASLGREARFDLDAGAFESAAALYLQQLASGDLGAVTSLLTVASRSLVANPDLKRLAKDPVLRQLISAFMLTRTLGEEGAQGLPERWLAVMEFMELPRVEDAERLGWAAYSLGRYDVARRWLARAEPDSGLALWLRAKLEFRAGHLAEAAAALGKAVPRLPRDEKMELRDLSPDELIPTFKAVADLGLLRLARTEFVGALRTLLSANHWQDAAYIAERVLTTDELAALIKQDYTGVPDLPIKQPNPDEEPFRNAFDHTPTTREETARQLRWLLARRLIRSERFAAAQPYLPGHLRPVLDRYSAALKEGGAAGAKIAQGTALWEAAQIARKNGMELMGSEMEPDAFIWDGQFPEEEVARDRQKGTYLARQPADQADNPPGAPRPEKVGPLVLPSSLEERRRLTRYKIQPDRRFHYRYVAADLAWRAAQLLPDNSEQTAQVLNSAGLWLMARDDAAADRFYQALERRCPRTSLGKEAIGRHWFVPPPAEADPGIENGGPAR